MLAILEDCLITLNQKRLMEGFAGRRNNYAEYISKGDDNKNLSPEEYLDIIRPYLNDLINDHKASGEWKFNS